MRDLGDADNCSGFLGRRTLLVIDGATVCIGKRQ